MCVGAMGGFRYTGEMVIPIGTTLRNSKEDKQTGTTTLDHKQERGGMDGGRGLGEADLLQDAAWSLCLLQTTKRGSG